MLLSRLGFLMLLTTALALGGGGAFAVAGEDAQDPVGAAHDPASNAPAAANVPAATDSSDAPVAAEPVVVAPPAAVIDRRPAARSSADPVFGVALRLRYVSVPGWFLGLFTKHNMPLGTVGHYGVEAFRRGGHFQIGLAVSYQNMSPPDGNWLGSGHDPMIDTRFLQFRGLSLYSADVSFLWQTMLSSWFGLHAGAGLGVGIVRGSVYLNTSMGCTENNLDDLGTCHPDGVTCTNGVCTPVSALSHKASSDVLPLVPIVDVVLGVDFRLPDVKGWEAKLEVGFFDAFFGGLGLGYTF